jgi:ABC-type sugar transport system permease subunit
LEYYNRALKINPESQRARQGVEEVRNRLQKAGQALLLSDTQPIRRKKEAHHPSQANYKRRVGLWLIAPWLIGLVLFKLVPILATLGMSFTNMYLLEPFQYKFVGLKNYIEFFTDPRLGVAVLGTLKSALILIPLQVLAAVALASLLSSQKLHFKNTLRMLFFLPSIIASFPAYLMWQGFTNPQSGWLYPLFINPLGLAKYVNFLGVGVIPLVKLLSTLWSIGPGFLIMMGAMQGIPTDVYEAALVEGASRLRRFFSITMPMISQAIFFTLILNLTTLFGGTIMMDTGYAFKTDLSSVDAFLYDLLFYSFHLGSAASLAWIFFIVMLVVVLVLFATSKRWVYFPDRED